MTREIKIAIRTKVGNKADAYKCTHKYVRVRAHTHTRAHSYTQEKEKIISSWKDAQEMASVIFSDFSIGV